MDPFWQHVIIVAALLIVGYLLFRPRKQKRSQVLFECSMEYFELKKAIATCKQEDLPGLEEKVNGFFNSYRSRANVLYDDYTKELHTLIGNRTVELEKAQ